MNNDNDSTRAEMLLDSLRANPFINAFRFPKIGFRWSLLKNPPFSGHSQLGEEASRSLRLLDVGWALGIGSPHGREPLCQGSNLRMR